MLRFIDAKKLGVTRYLGKPCTGCGGTERYTSSKSCVPCDNERKRAGKLRSRFDGLEFVYECYSSNGELLYVGRTNNPANRFRHHGQMKPWFSEVSRVTWTQYDNPEQLRILDKQPKYNKLGSKP